ncbi:MAG: DUF2252 domain-containing protein [Acidimicrobiales bacterium]
MSATLDARRAAGRRLRAEVPRRALAEVADRPDGYDPVQRLMWQGESRVAALLPLRYQRMSVNPLAFYRGAALLMAEDLALGESTPLEVQICGDAHAANFGVFSSPERRLVFDLNDFDETDVGPFEWDVKRLATSLALAADQLGADDATRTAVVEDVAAAYQRSVALFAAATRLETWYAALDVELDLSELRGFFTDAAARAVDDVIRRARNREAKSFAGLVTTIDGAPRIRVDPPLVTAIGAVVDPTLLDRPGVEGIIAGYAGTLNNDRRALLSQFTPVDAAHIVRGVGSVGTQCFAVLLIGRDEEDLMFLQVKEAQRSVVAVARGASEPREPGDRVVAGQQMMQATPDILLGWFSVEADRASRSFYVRQLYDQRAAVALERLSVTQLRAYGRACAWVLARAHARSGQAAEIAGYVGVGRQWALCIGAFAVAYRDRTHQDFRAFTDALAQGRVRAAT